MMDRKALVGLLSGIALVIATLVVVALLNVPETASAARSAGLCSPGVKGEHGYGVADPACATVTR